MNGRLLTPQFGAVKMATNYHVECWRLFHDNGEACERAGKGCRHAHKPVKMWEDRFHNLVNNAGLDALLNNSFNAAAGSVNWFVGLVGAGAGTVSETSAANAVTGSGTTFDAGLAVAPIADIIIVGAGAAGADLVTTVASRSSNTAITTTANAGTTVAGAAYATETIAGDTIASHINSWTDSVPYSNATRPAWTKNGASSGGAMSNSASKAAFTINATGRIFGLFLISDNTKSGTAGTMYGMGLFTGGSRSVQSGDTLNAQVDLSATAA
jgi:hypothetical protein